jgi:hypothetical protein
MKRSFSTTFLLLTSVLASIAIIDDGTSAQVPPSITGIHVLNVDEDSFEIEWETDTPSKCTVEWGKTKAYGESKEIGGTYETNFVTNITGLDRTTEYHFRIVAESLGGGVGNSPDRTVTTGPQADVEGNTPGWVWGLLSVAIIVGLVYLFLLRPARS